VKELKETHQRGYISLENPEIIRKMLDNSHIGDFGLQIAKDGRVWVCINGVAFIRFKPEGMGFGEVLSQSEGDR